MAITLKRFATAQIADTAEGYYTPAGVNAQIDAVTLTNTSGSAVTVSLWTTLGGAPTNQNIILKDYTVGSSQSTTVASLRGHVIEDGNTLYAQASVAGVVTMVVSGREQTV